MRSGASSSVEIIPVPVTHPDALALLSELNSALALLTGNDGTGSFDVEAFDAETGKFLLAYCGNEPVACGCLRRHDESSCEIKRMYSREKGCGSLVLSALVAEAAAAGYRRVVLSTRKVNLQAVSFYKKYGFVEMLPYGKYVKSDLSICMEKELMQGD